MPRDLFEDLGVKAGAPLPPGRDLLEEFDVESELPADAEAPRDLFGELGIAGPQTPSVSSDGAPDWVEQQNARERADMQDSYARSGAAFDQAVASPVAAPQPPPTFDTSNAPGLVTPGNIDLFNRPQVKNPDGSISTVRSMSFNMDGKEVLVPTVSEDGRIMGDDEAVETYRKTGKHLGIFDTRQNASAYSQRLHDQQDAFYRQRPPAAPPPTAAPQRPQDPERIAIDGMIAQAEQDAARIMPDLVLDEIEVPGKRAPPFGTPEYQRWKASLSPEERAAIEADERSVGLGQEKAPAELSPGHFLRRPSAPIDPAQEPAVVPGIEQRGAPIDEQTYLAIKGAYDAATPQERVRMMAQGGWRGSVAKAIDRQYRQLDTDKARMPALGVADTRVEARAQRYGLQGASPEVAGNMAATEMRFGATEKPVATVKPSAFDFEASKGLRPDGSTSQMVRRGAYLGRKQLKQQVLGLHEAIGDLIGAEDYAAVMGRGHKEAQREIETAGEAKTAFERNFEGAIASTISQGPGMALAVATGTQAVPLMMMGAQVFGQEYATGKAAGLDKPAAITRAGIQGAAEIIGEKLSLGATTTAMREGIRRAVDAVRRAPVDATRETLSNLFLKSLGKENVGEQITTAVQFWADKAPEIGLNQQATPLDYLNAVADTLVQTTIQSGLMAGAGMGPSVVVRAVTDRGESKALATARAESAKEKALAQWRQAFHPEGKREPGGAPADRVPGAAGVQVTATGPEPETPSGITTAGAKAPLPQEEVAAVGRITAGQEREPVAVDRKPQPPLPADAERAAPFSEPIPAYKSHDRAKLEALKLTRLGTPSRVTPHPTEAGMFAVVPREPIRSVSQKAADERRAEPTVEDIHALADRKLIPWDNDPDFMALTEEVTGKKHLDELSAAQRKVLFERLYQKPDSVDQDQTGEAIDTAADEAATSPANDLPEPTEGQKEAGNYKKGHVSVSGLDISIENPVGSTRSGTDASGKPWSVTMKSHYGYIVGVPARAPDKEHVDVYVKPGSAPDFEGDVFVVNQIKPETGRFDEPKVMIAYQTEAEAKGAYLENYTKDWKGLQSIVRVPMERFRSMLQDPDVFKQPVRPGETRADLAVDGRDVGAMVRVVDGPVSIKGQVGTLRPNGKIRLESGEVRPHGESARFENLRKPKVSGISPSMVFASENTAELKAKTLTTAGSPSVVIPHPTAEGKFAVVPRAPVRAAPVADRSEPDLTGKVRETIPPESEASALASALRNAADAIEQATKGREATRPSAKERAVLGMPEAAAPAYTAPDESSDIRPDVDKARPDAIREAITKLLNVPINERRFNVRRAAGIFKIKPQTIRVRNINDIDTISHEVGHHFSETSKLIRRKTLEHRAELLTLTPSAYTREPLKLRIEEGFAEFARLYLTRPEAAKAAAPKFHASFEEYAKAYSYLPIFEEIRGMIGQWQKLDPVERIMAKVGSPKKSIADRLGETFGKDRLIFEVLDNWLPLKRMVEDLAPDVAASRDPFKAAHLLAGDVAIIEDWLTRGTIPFDYAKRADPKNYGMPLHAILKPVANELRGFTAYLIAKRAEELHKVGKERLYTPAEIRAGLALETPAFKATAQELYDYQDRLLDYAVEGGLLSPEVADKFREYTAYIPFFRESDDTGGGPTSRSPFKRLFGGTANLRDPLTNIIENTATIIHATNRNAVLAKAHELAKAVPGGGRWIEEIPIPQQAVQLSTQRILDQLAKQGATIDREAAKDLAAMQTFFRSDVRGDKGERIIVIKDQGEPKALQINSRMLWHALEAFEPFDLGLVGTILAVPSDMLRAGVTLSPEFMARNFMRDTISGFIQSKHNMIPVLNTAGGFKAVATRSEAAKLYRAFGGAYADMWKGESEQTRKTLERMAKRGKFDPRTILTPAGIVGLLHGLGSISEAGTRVAEFEKTMKPGDIDSLIDAAYNAREVSVDFGMHGHSKTIRLLTRITPFLNPAMQGFYKMARTGQERFLVTLLRGSALTMFSVALFLMNRDEDWYDEIEPWERDVYWHFDVGFREDDGRVIPIRIPKPFEWGAMFGSVPEALADLAITKSGKDFANRLLSILENVFALRTVPTAALVPAELWANRNTFTDRPIVSEGKEGLDPGLQFGPGTSLTARAIGAGAGISPAKIDHAIRGFFGTMGVYAVGLADQGIRYLGDIPAGPKVPWKQMPVIKAFVHDPDSANSRHVTEFYDMLEQARRANASHRKYEGDEADAYYELHQQDIDLVKDVNRRARELANLRKENEEIRASRDYTGDEKMRMIGVNNIEIKRLAKEFVLDRARGQRDTKGAGQNANTR